MGLGSQRAGPSLAAKRKPDLGGEEDDDEEITAATLRRRPRPLPLSALSTFGYVPPRREDPKEHSYFYGESQTGVAALYDCVFNRDPGYDQRLHRDDREHAKSLGLHVNKEEQERPVGVLMSSVYGRRINQPLEPQNTEYRRANHLNADFYRKNDIPSLKEPGFGHISPV